MRPAHPTTFAVLILLIVLPDTPVSWDLSVLKISPIYYASSIAVYKNRAFLALPRSSCYNNLTNPTLVEVPWYRSGKHGLFRKKTYPHYMTQRWGSCKDHQDAISVDLDAKKGKLWVLDKGNEKCPPKIVIYNLYYNTIGLSSKLVGVPAGDLSVLVLDPEVGNSGSMAYIGGIENRILIFSPRGLNVWKIDIVSGSEVSISTGSLAISTRESSLLYLTGTDDYNLHRVNLTRLREYAEVDYHRKFKGVSLEINATTIGEKLGPSSGMMADSKGGLYYYLIRDYAIVKWNTSMPLVAEYHDVLMQSYDALPFVSHVFYGPKNTIWALTNPGKSEICHQNNWSGAHGDLPKLKSRVVLIE